MNLRGGACSTQRTNEKYIILIGKQETIGRRTEAVIILKCVSDNLTWLRIGSDGGLVWTWWWSSAAHDGRDKEVIKKMVGDWCGEVQMEDACWHSRGNDFFRTFISHPLPSTLLDIISYKLFFRDPFPFVSFLRTVFYVTWEKLWEISAPY
jgi:hypothetical protein